MKTYNLTMWNTVSKYYDKELSLTVVAILLILHISFKSFYNRHINLTYFVNAESLY